MDTQNVLVRRRGRREEIAAIRDSALQKCFINQAIFLGWEHVVAKVQVVAMVIY